MEVLWYKFFNYHYILATKSKLVYIELILEIFKVNKMLAVKATYENGKIIPLDNLVLPKGKKNVIITFLDDEEELSDEWKAELDRRIEAIDNGSEKLIPGEEVFKKLKQKYS